MHRSTAGIGQGEILNVWDLETWAGTFLFCAAAPLLGMRILPYLVRTPTCCAESFLGALSLGALVTALLTDLVHRIVSYLSVGGFLISLLVCNSVVLAALLALRQSFGPRQVILTKSSMWSLRSTTISSRIAFGVIGILAALALFSPIFGNDQFEYFAVAEQWSIRGVEGYPPTTGSLEGFVVAPSSHPTAYHTLVATLGLSGFPLMFHLVYLTISISSVLYVAGFVKEPGLYILTFCGTPIFLSQLTTRSIDPIWLAGLQVGTLSLIELGRTSNALRTLCTRHLLASLGTYAIAMALVIGFHSVGLIALALLLGSVLMVLRPSLLQVAVMTGAAFWALLISNQYIINFIRYQSPVQDSAPVFTLANLEFEADLVIRRGLASTSDKLLTGALRGFTDYLDFGLVAWLALLSLFVLILRSTKSGRCQFVSVQLVVLFTSIIFFVISAILDVNLAIKNARYWQILLPSMATVIGSVSWRE